jgi:hypothetical protein
MSYNSKNKVYFVKNDHSSTYLFKKYGAIKPADQETEKSTFEMAAQGSSTQEDENPFIEKDICPNKRTKILLSVSFFVLFSTSNFILQLLNALSPSLWPGSFRSILILSLNFLGSAVLTFILLGIFTFNGIDQLVIFRPLIILKLFTIAVFILLIVCEIVSLIIGSYSPFSSWICAVLSLLVFISSWIHGGYYCLKNKKNEEDSH